MGSTIIQTLKDAAYTIRPHVYKSKAHERFDTFHAPYTITSQTGVVIDLHFFLFPKKFEITIDQDKMLAAASQRTTKNGNSYAYFTEIDHFLYVCLHAYKHLWRDEFKFSSFADMKLLLSQQLQDVSRSTIQERANELGCLDPAMRMLDLFCRLFPKSFTNEAPAIVDKHQLLLWKKVCADLNLYTLTKKDKRQRFTYRRFNLSKSTLLQPQLLFYELFPSPSYLRTYFPGKNYITRWFKRIM